MHRLIIVNLCFAWMLLATTPALGIGINTNTALAPAEGDFIYRFQFRYLQSTGSPGATDVELTRLVIPNVLVYGLREDLTLFGVVPLVIREGTSRAPAPPGTFTDLGEAGIGDLRFFAKYRLWSFDEPGETTRFSVLGGLEIPTFDEPFSSESVDPFIGWVFTHQTQKGGVDLDLIWKLNTGEDFYRHDNLFYDVAYTKVLMTGQNLDETYWQINAVLELNGSYTTNGSNLIFVAPGIQLALENLIVEASVQLPAVRSLKTGLEPDIIMVFGARLIW